MRKPKPFYVRTICDRGLVSPRCLSFVTLPLNFLAAQSNQAANSLTSDADKINMLTCQTQASNILWHEQKSEATNPRQGANV